MGSGEPSRHLPRIHTPSERDEPSEVRLVSEMSQNEAPRVGGDPTEHDRWDAVGSDHQARCTKCVPTPMTPGMTSQRIALQVVINDVLE